MFLCFCSSHRVSNLSELREAGYDASALRDASFSIHDLKEAGFELAEVTTAGYTERELQSWDEAHPRTTRRRLK